MNQQQTLKFKNKLYLGFGTILLLMGLIAGTVYINVSKLNKYNKQVDHSYEVIRVIEKSGKHFVDMETGVRGFLVAGKDEFLDPYQEGLTLFDETWKKGKKLTDNNLFHTQRWDALVKLKDEWVRSVALPEINMRKEVQEGKTATDEFNRISGRTLGKKIFDQLRITLESVKKSFIEVENIQGADLVTQILIDLLNQETGQRGFLLSGKEESLQPFIEGKASFEQHFKLLEDRKHEGKGADALQINRIRSLVKSWYEDAANLEIETRREMNKYPMKIGDVTKLLESGKGKRLMDQMRTIQAEMVVEEEALLHLRSMNVANILRLTVAITIFGSLLALALGMITAFFIVKGTMRELGGEPEEIALLADRVAKGDLTLDVVESDTVQIGIYGSLLRMHNNLRGVVNQADSISHGDYNQKVQPLSDQDELGIALARMAERLRVVSDLNEQESAFKSGQAELGNTLRGEVERKNLCGLIITYLATYFNAHVGAFYLKGDGDVLELVASYAYRMRKTLSNTFSLGEGLVGQAALEGEPILITEVPEDYIQISSGLGHSQPKSILVYPIVYMGEVKGVIELGSTNVFTELDFNFMSQASENIAIALNSSESRKRMADLLEKSQLQAEKLQAQQEELQTQQEELRQTNEVLGKQKESLVVSESRLQAQQEELRQTNEELQEQTQLLEEQKNAIEEKNQELKITHKLIEDKADDLEQTSKYKTEFLANMSHELRTPLNSILLLSNLMADTKENSMTAKQIEYSETIHSSGTELLELINEILDLSKVESGKMEIHPENLKLSEFAQRMERTFIPQAQSKGLEMIVNVEDGLPLQVRTDRQRLEQIIKNLLSNALKFTQQGSITLTVARPAGITQLEDKALPQEETIAFSVHDTGEGIVMEKQRLIFEAFQQVDGTTSRRFGGSGLGLAIAKELAKLLGGDITLESSPGEGSIFTVYLPEDISLEKQPETDEEPQEIKEVDELPEQSLPAVEPRKVNHDEVFILDDRDKITPGDKTILIIEDDPKFAKTLAELARERGYKVLVAGDGEMGLHFADFYGPNAIVLDIGLPGMDGWAVMSRLKEQPNTRHIPVHFISAFDQTNEARKMGAIGFITKPVSMAMLDEAFEKIGHLITGTMRELLVIEDDAVQRQAMLELIGNGDVQTTEAATGAEALELIRSKSFDCLILDLGLPDMSGVDFLTTMKEDDLITEVPVIVYTGKDLTSKEESIINEYAEKIIIKGVKSPERLLDETTLFLHRIEENLSEEKRKMIRKLHSRESVFKDKTILVVDDDMRNVYAITSVLEEKGLNILAARDGRHGIETLQANPRIDLVLMDIMMPEMNGYEAMGAIRTEERFKKLPIIALTAKAMKGDRKKCIEAGANDYLAKPVETDKLLSMLRVWLYG